MVERAVVLGPGGPVGTAWLAGLAAGMRREGVDLGAADLIVGTSAGAIVGAMLAAGRDLDQLSELPEGGATRPDPKTLGEAFATLGVTGPRRAEALRRIGRIAIDASTGGEETVIARMRFLVGADWPDRPLLIPSVDAETGEAVVWDRHGAASLAQAVAASIAFPGLGPPITIGGHRYIDGALRNGSNIDLADDANVLILAEPMAHLNGAVPDERTAVRLVPDAEAIEAFGPDLTDRSAWAPAYRAGVRQAPEAARRVRR
jgi:NTE family protein